MRDALRFGLVGCGTFGRIFSQYVQEVGDVVALCDSNLVATHKVAGQLAIDVPCYDDYRKMLESESLDAVVITSANFTHADMTIAAAEAGCHVYCEKAMARTTVECWQMIDACNDNHVKLMVGHKRRLRPPWSRMIELTEDSKLGEVLSITVSQYCDRRSPDMYDSWWTNPALSGGFFHMQGVHVIDWFRAMCGEVKRIRAVYGPQHDPRLQFRDIAHATFEFESGAVASLNGSMAFPLQQFRQCQGPIVQCRHGGMKMVPEMDHIDLYWQHADHHKMHHEYFADLGHEAAFRRELSDFAKWVLEDHTPCLTWIEGLRCVELMEAACRSASQDGHPISLPLYPELEKRAITGICVS